MSETYCGKNCDECAWMAEEGCPGCENGPGRLLARGGNCKLASCCRDKGHRTCESCDLRAGCGKYLDRYRYPAERKKQAEEEKRMIEVYTERSDFLIKWFRILLILTIPYLIAYFLTRFSVETSSSARNLHIAGSLISLLTSVVYGSILLRMSSVEKRYHTAGICVLISSAIDFLDLIFSLSDRSGTAFSVLVYVLLVLSVITTLCATYKEYSGHSAVFNGIDSYLCEKWARLWILFICSLGGVFVSVLFMFISIGFGLFLLIISCIAVLIGGILKLVYLHSSAEKLTIYRDDHTNNR